MSMSGTGEIQERCLDSTSFRVREGNKTRFWLWIAVGFMITRAAIAPWCRFAVPSMFDIDSPTDEIIVYSSILVIACISLAILLTRLMPVIACLIALSGYGCWLYYDLTHYVGMMPVGTVGKVLVGMMLVRALISAVMSRVL